MWPTSVALSPSVKDTLVKVRVLARQDLRETSTPTCFSAVSEGVTTSRSQKQVLGNALFDSPRLATRHKLCAHFFHLLIHSTNVLWDFLCTSCKRYSREEDQRPALQGHSHSDG